MTKVSVIVPVYNADKVLQRCVDSVLAQEFRDFELLLMDDGSTDGSAALCDACAARDTRVRVIHKENTGVSDTRNRAIALAEGDYLQFLDADDWITPEATGLLVRTAEEKEADLVVSDFYRVVKRWTSPKGSIDEEGMLTREQFADWMAKSPADYYFGVLWNKLYRRDIVLRYGLRMDKTLRWCEDFIFNMEYILHVSRIYVLKVPLYYYVKTEGSLVQRGMKIGSIVRMKLMMIEYFSNFYKNIYSADDYELRRAEIYSFLIDYSHDDLALPILPGTRKLGAERMVAAHAPRKRGAWVWHYYTDMMLRRKLSIAAARFDLDYREAWILMFLHSFGAPENLRELSDSLGVTQITAAALIQRLALRGLLTVELGKPATAALTEEADKLLRTLNEAAEDAETAGTEVMTEEELAQYRALREKAAETLRFRLER